MVNKADQTITFGPLGPVYYGMVPITLGATSNSGLAVSYSIVSGPGTISGNKLTLTASGSIVIQADQAGNGNYNAASAVQQTVVVNINTVVSTTSAVDDGNYAPGNVRGAGVRGPVTGIVDWGGARPGQPALIDEYLMILTATCEVERTDLGTVVA